MRRDRWLLLMMAIAPARLAAQQADSARSPLSLAQAIQRAMQSSTDVLVANAAVSESKARQRQARAAILPTLRAGGSWANRTFNIHTFGLEFPTTPGTTGFPDLVGPFSVFDARAQVTQTLLDFSAWAHIRSDGAAVAVREAFRSVASERAAAVAGEAYLRLARARALVAAREADTRLAEELSRLAQAQLEAGLSAGIDATRARTQLAAARSELLLARNDEARASITLARSLGGDPSQRFTLTDTLTASLGASSAPQDRAAALELARERLPDLKVQRQVVARAGLEARAIKAERLPRVEVEGDWGLSGTTADNALGTRQVALQVSLPLWDGMRREGRIAEQAAAIDAARARERDVEMSLAEEVDRALLDVRSAGEQERIAADRVALAEQELSEARERFQRGISGNIEVIEAQASLVRARDAAIEARYGGAAARLRLARATGTMDTVH